MKRPRIHILILIAFVFSASHLPANPILDSQLALHHDSLQSHANHQTTGQPELAQADDCCNDFIDAITNHKLSIHQCDEPCHCAVNGCAETQVYNILPPIIYPLIEPRTTFLDVHHNLHQPYLQRPERVPIS